MLELRPTTLREANAYVDKHHRHSDPVQGQKFAVACADAEGKIRGVAIAARPVAGSFDQDGYILEIRRVCTDGARNACSMLYGACCRAGGGMGYRKAITYTLKSEGGASLRAAGFRPVADVAQRQWDRKKRPREQVELFDDKIRWERVL